MKSQRFRNSELKFKIVIKSEVSAIESIYLIIKSESIDLQKIFLRDSIVLIYVNKQKFFELMKFKYPTHQISFHTIKALACINFVESYEVTI